MPSMINHAIEKQTAREKREGRAASKRLSKRRIAALNKVEFPELERPASVVATMAPGYTEEPNLYPPKVKQQIDLANSFFTLPKPKKVSLWRRFYNYWLAWPPRS